MILLTGASEASSKWVGTTMNYSNGSKKWVGNRPYSLMIRQKSGWARAHLAHPAPTPLVKDRLLFKAGLYLNKFNCDSLERFGLQFRHYLVG